MKLITMKNRELLDLSIVLIFSLIFTLFSISINFIDRLYSFFGTYTDLPLAEFLINISFLSLAGLLWITYIRWRRTAKRQAELENIISSISPDVFMVIDSDRNIIMCNATVKRMFGYQIDQVINQKIDLLYFDRRSDPEQRHEIFDILKRDGFHIGLATGKKKDGETIPLEIIAGNLSGSNGAVLLLRDITERKRAEEALQESEERLRAIFDGAIDTIFTKDLQGYYTQVNNACAQLFKLPKDDILGKTDFDLFPESYARHIVETDKWVLRDGKMVVDEGTKPMGGTMYTFHIIKVPLRDSEGKMTGLCGIARDITERKRIEEKLKEYALQIEEKNLELKAKNQELVATRAQLVQEEKLRALGQMASGLAHNFNNLLAIILGRAQLLLWKAKEVEIEKGLRSIEKATLDASSTIKRIQDFARTRKDQEFKWINLEQVIKDVIALTKTKWKDQAEATGITIELEVIKDRRKLPPVAGDASELREAFTNIIFNAVEAIPKRGKIVIGTKSDKESVFVYFTDTGTGIPDQIKHKIFDPFFTTKGIKNTGLGLSVAYGIIERHQGDIQIKSKPGEGTTVVVRLPVSKILRKEESKKREPGKPLVQQDSAKILVIEDEQDVRELLFDILSSANYAVKVTSGGAEGLEIYKREKFDIVLTDLGMPKMSGWEVAKAIKEIDSNTTVLLITGWGVEMDDEKLKKSGIDQVVTKPIKVKSLLTLVSEITESKKRAKEPVEGFCSTKD
ncbi:MAG: PAS domain S-box protein [candidate division Zixibacteria bacterium]|nr:PAS domain S-box protein [candidate division Zixibacteria bacterium]